MGRVLSAHPPALVIVQALWRGLTPTYMRLAPWHTFFFVVYEQASIALTGAPMPTR